MTRIMEIQNKTIPYKKYKPNEGGGADRNATKHSANKDELITERQEPQKPNKGLVNLISTIKRKGI